MVVTKLFSLLVVTNAANFDMPGKSPVLPGLEESNQCFIKVPKCASSTSGGVARRMAAYRNLSHVFDGNYGTLDPAFNDLVEPKVFANHIQRSHMERHKEWKHLRFPVFPIWSMIRHPNERALSEYYHFVVERTDVVPSDDGLIAYLRDGINRNLMFNYLRPNHCPKEDENITCVLDAYDFVGTVELLDESMVQLASIAKVPLESVLYLPSKLSSARENPNAVNYGEESQSPTVKAFLASSYWKSKTSVDLALWYEVGRRVSEKARDPRLAFQLENYTHMLDVVATNCVDPHFENCYWKDNGCGFRCIDSIFGGGGDPDHHSSRDPSSSVQDYASSSSSSDGSGGSSSQRDTHRLQMHQEQPNPFTLANRRPPPMKSSPSHPLPLQQRSPF